MPRQRRHRRRQKVDHHPPASCFIGARRRRRPYDQSCEPTFARMVLRFALIPGACAAPGIKCVPQGPRRRVRRLDWPDRGSETYPDNFSDLGQFHVDQPYKRQSSRETRALAGCLGTAGHRGARGARTRTGTGNRGNIGTYLGHDGTYLYRCLDSAWKRAVRDACDCVSARSL